MSHDPYDADRPLCPTAFVSDSSSKGYALLEGVFSDAELARHASVLAADGEGDQLLPPLLALHGDTVEADEAPGQIGNAAGSSKRR